MPTGTFFALADFVDRMLPKRGAVDPELLLATLDGLKRVAAVQEENAWVTVDATVTAGVWIYYRGLRRWLLNPAQKYIRLETPWYSAAQPDIAPCLQQEIQSGNIERTAKQEFRQWRVLPAGLPAVWDFFETLKRPTGRELHVGGDPMHPRTFPGAVRELALDRFNREGRVCPGVSGVNGAKRHKLRRADRIEYDHILPVAERGSSGSQNIQILCTACNRLKGASAK